MSHYLQDSGRQLTRTATIQQLTWSILYLFTFLLVERDDFLLFGIGNLGDDGHVVHCDVCVFPLPFWMCFLSSSRARFVGKLTLKLVGLKARRTCEPPEPAGLAADQRRRGGGGGGGGANQQAASTVGRGGWDPGRPGWHLGHYTTKKSRRC